MYRTHTCGELRASHAGQTVTVSGWINRRRDHGGVAFFDLRDRSGIIQITINPDLPKERLDIVAGVRFEWVLQIEGQVHKRPAGNENPNMETGEIEIIAQNVTILNPAKTLRGSTGVYIPCMTHDRQKLVIQASFVVFPS